MKLIVSILDAPDLAWHKMEDGDHFPRIGSVLPALLWLEGRDPDTEVRRMETGLPLEIP